MYVYKKKEFCHDKGQKYEKNVAGNGTIGNHTGRPDISMTVMPNQSHGRKRHYYYFRTTNLYAIPFFLQMESVGNLI